MVTKHNHTVRPVTLTFSEQIATGIYLFGFHGDFQFEAGQVIDEGYLTPRRADHQLPDTGLKYYLCGSAEMMVETRYILIGKGIPFDRIISEIYF